MYFSYKKLWKLLIDRDINKTQLHFITGLSQATITKLAKNQNINTDVLLKICSTLNCKLEDIVDLIEGDKNDN